jgi:hypothetical protein
MLPTPPQPPEKLEIPAPKNTSIVPDGATQKGIKDYTGIDGADGRVFHINLGFFKYGTDDKIHGAAMVFSLLLFICVVCVMIFGDGSAWADKLFSWATGAFLFALGIALGKGAGGKE